MVSKESQKAKHLSLWVFATCWLWCGVVGATDSRLALLVGNQYGWDGDPKLQYVLSGDVHPLASRLRKLGFQVHTLQNQSSLVLRKTLFKIRKKLQKKKISTFLFYYSGHADQNHLHLGKRQKKPMSYKELVSFFRTLTSLRRIAIIDACYSGELIRQFGSLRIYQKWFSSAKAKGLRARKRVNLSRLLVPRHGKEQGLRVIASSLGLSWEIPQFRASLFTHHLLRGLDGKGDLDRDGKITVDELFDFASREVKQLTGQHPQQLVVLKRQRPYTLAPAYQSRLWIGPNVLGTLKISVANFVWSQEKNKRQAIRLAVVNGKGLISLQHASRCFQQAATFPKNGELRLSSRWKTIPCTSFRKVRKGTVHLKASPYIIAPYHYQRSLLLLTGFSNGGSSPVNSYHVNGGVHLRLGKWGFGLLYQQGIFSEKSFGLSRYLFQLDMSWPLLLGGVRSSWSLSPGWFAQLGGVHQYQSERTALAPTLALGGLLALEWRWHPHWGLRLQGQAGIEYTPVLELSGISFVWQAQMAALWAF